jgi:hypothetical protein
LKVTADALHTAVTPERAVADILCAAIGRLSGDGGRHGHDSGSGGSDSGGSEEGEEFDPAEAARRAALVRAAGVASFLCPPRTQLPLSVAFLFVLLILKRTCAGSAHDNRASQPPAAPLQIEAAVDAPTLEGFINGTRCLPRSELLETPGKVICAGKLAAVA